MGRSGLRVWAVPRRAARETLLVMAAVCALAVTGVAATMASAAVPPAEPAVTAAPTGASSAATASTGVVFRADFEDGTDGFTGDPSSVAVALSSVASSGSASLAVSGLTAYGQGAQVTLPAGLPTGYYGVSAQVRLPSGQAQDMQMLVSSSSVTYSQAGTVRATATTWTSAPGFFRVSGTTAPITLQVRPVAHCSDAPAVPLPFLVDSVSVVGYGGTPPPSPMPPTPTCPQGGGSTGPTVTTTTTSSAACQVSYAVVSRWPGGYQVAITIRCPTTITGWKLGWTFAPGQTLTALWGGVGSQSDRTVTVTNPPWNPVIVPGSVVQVGLIVAASSPQPTPQDFTMNGSPCVVTSA